MEKLLFEQMGGIYTQVGDYLLPDVELPEEKSISVWGTRHYHHLTWIIEHKTAKNVILLTVPQDVL